MMSLPRLVWKLECHPHIQNDKATERVRNDRIMFYDSLQPGA